MTLGQRIRERRLALGLSQAELARQAGTEARQIRRYEADETQPSLTLAGLLARALRLSLDELVGSDDDPLVGTWKATLGDGTDLTKFEVSIESAGDTYALWMGVLQSPREQAGELREVGSATYAMDLRAGSFTEALTARLRLEAGELVGLALSAIDDEPIVATPLRLSRSPRRTARS